MKRPKTPKNTLILTVTSFSTRKINILTTISFSMCHISYKLALKVSIFVYTSSLSTENLGKFWRNSRISLGKIWIFQDYSGDFSSNRVGNYGSWIGSWEMIRDNYSLSLLEMKWKLKVGYKERNKNILELSWFWRSIPSVRTFNIQHSNCVTSSLIVDDLFFIFQTWSDVMWNFGTAAIEIVFLKWRKV